MLPITPEVVSLGVSPPRQRLEGDDDDDDDDEATCGCLPSRQRLRVVRPPRQRLDRCTMCDSTVYLVATV